MDMTDVQTSACDVCMQQVCLVPLLDLMNHAAPDLANVIVHQDEGNGSYGCTATRAIRAGEEVHQNSYSILIFNSSI